MEKVYIKQLFEYNLEELIENIEQGLNNFINLDDFFKIERKVFIKVNAVSHLNYKLGYTTHPIFVKAIIRVLKKYNATVVVGDNPPMRPITSVLKGNGILAVCKEENVSVLTPTASVVINSELDTKYNDFEVSEEMLCYDLFINAAKLKTHSLTYYSGVQKNLFGLIPGLKKAGWHAVANNPNLFSEMINDLYLAFLENVKCPVIHMIDGIDCLEGEGPTTSGTLGNANIIGISNKGVSLDTVMLKCNNLDFKKSLVTLSAQKRNIEESNLENIIILGDNVDLFLNNKMKEPTKPLKQLKLLNNKLIRNLILDHPIINEDKCKGCNECVKICPAKTLKIRNNDTTPSLNINSCIRCWCCSEVCQHNAIERSKRPLLGRMLFKK